MKSLNKIALSLLSLTLIVPAVQGVNRPWKYETSNFDAILGRLNRQSHQPAQNFNKVLEELKDLPRFKKSWYFKAYDNVKSGAKKAWDYAKVNPSKTAGAVVGTAATAGLIYLLAKSLVKKDNSKEITETKIIPENKTSSVVVGDLESCSELEQQILAIIDELLDINKNPEKSFSEYAAEIIEISKDVEEYKEACALLDNAKSITSALKFQTALDELQTKMPKFLGKKLKEKVNKLGLRQKLKVANIRLK